VVTGNEPVAQADETLGGGRRVVTGSCRWTEGLMNI
jgi:hypothetical protein